MTLQILNKTIGVTMLLIVVGCVGRLTVPREPLRDYFQEEDVLPVPLYDLGFGRCGFSAVKQIISFYFSPERSDELVVEGRFCDTIEMVTLLRSFSVPASLEVCGLDQLSSDLSKGSPVIVLVSPASGVSRWFFPKAVPRHVWVVCGVSKDGKWWAVNTPEAGRIAVPREDLKTRWRTAGNVVVRVCGD